MKRNALTLIEVAIIITIIALLAAIIIPSISRYGHGEPEDRVIINGHSYRKVEISGQYYLQDYEGRLVPYNPMPEAAR